MTGSPATERFVYYIPFPPFTVGIAITFASFLLCAFLFIPYSLGIQHTLRSMHDDPLFWLFLIVMFGPAIAFLGLLAFPPKGWLMRLEVTKDRLRLVPTLLLRWIGEPTQEMRIDESSEEILVCRGSVDAIPFGYRVSVAPENGQERELKIESGARLNRQQAAIFANGIAEVTRLPVRLFQRESSADGQTREVPWLPDGRFAFSRSLAMVALGLAPWIGGIVVGLIGTGTAVAAAVGVCLWLCQVVSLMLYARLLDGKSKFPMIHSLATVFTFAASYMVAYVLTKFLIHH
jgi:hypothetical protein